MQKIFPHPKPGKKKKKKRGVSSQELHKIYKIVINRDMACQNPFCKDGWPLDPPHHVIKRSQGGHDVPENLTLLCSHCHRKIHAEGKLKVTGIAPNDLTWTQIMRKKGK